MTHEEIQSFLYKIESLTKEFPNDADLGGAVRQIVTSLEKERGTSISINNQNTSQNNWGDADED